jgi:putative membrane protein
VNDLPARSSDRSLERSRRQRARLITGVVLGGLGVAFALVNLDEVEVNWIVGTWDTPLIIVIAISILVGAVLGYLAARRRKAS